MRYLKWLGIGLLLATPMACSNPESEEAGRAIRDAAVESGEAIEASAEEGIQETGAALEEVGREMQDSIESAPDEQDPPAGE